MKTKLLFSTIQYCKNSIFTLLIIFFMTASSFGQTLEIYGTDCLGAPGPITFKFDIEIPTQQQLYFGSVFYNGNEIDTGWQLTVVDGNRWEVWQSNTQIRWFYTTDLSEPCNATWLIEQNLGGNSACGDIVVSCTGGSPEVCDGIDNDGDGDIDEGVTTTFYADADGDTFGDVTNTVQACSAPAGYVADNTDCDDTVGSGATIYPGATEICDGLDNDCDGQTDEGLPLNTYYADTDADGYGDPSSSLSDCSQPVGYVTDSTDCDDLQYDVNPGAPEICDGVDNNCSDPNPAPDEDDQLYIDEGVDDCINGVIIDYCDDQQKKVLICHNGKTKCVSINAMDAHLAHGDYLGPCGGNSREGDVDISDENPTSHDVVSWPNPSNNLINVKMITPNTIDKVNIEAFDINGRLIHSNVINGNEDYQFGGQLSSGVYFVRLSQANTLKTIKIIKQ